MTTRKEVGSPRSLLFDKQIKSHLTGVDGSPDRFFDEANASVTFTGIFRAKGNEAGMVYIMNADRCASSFGSLARVRNQLFTAITRSKSWVRVMGVGPNMQKLMMEFDRIKAANFDLDFVYPNETVRRTMNIINRDMSDAEKQAAENSAKQLNKLVDDVEKGLVLVEDLPEDTVSRLRKMLDGIEQDG